MGLLPSNSSLNGATLIFIGSSGAQYTSSPLIFTSSTIGYRREGSGGRGRDETFEQSHGKTSEMSELRCHSEPAGVGFGPLFRPFARRSIRNHTELTCYYASRE